MCVCVCAASLPSPIYCSFLAALQPLPTPPALDNKHMPQPFVSIAITRHTTAMATPAPTSKHAAGGQASPSPSPPPKVGALLYLPSMHAAACSTCVELLCLLCQGHGCMLSQARSCQPPLAHHTVACMDAPPACTSHTLPVTAGCHSQLCKIHGRGAGAAASSKPSGPGLNPKP